MLKLPTPKFGAHVYISILLLLIIALPYPSHAAKVNYKKLYRSRISHSQYEIGKISFRGNNKYPSETLETIISSHATDRSFWYSFFEFTYRYGKDNRLIPKFAKKELYDKLNSLQSNIHFFSEETVSNDINNLRQFYHQHGNHQIKLDYEFLPNPKQKINELIFILDEGSDYIVNNIQINITDSIEQHLSEEINTEINKNKNIKFNEANILISADKSIYYLQNNGYFFANYTQPQIVINPEENNDSLTLNISPGLKYKIDSIFIEHDTRGQIRLASVMSENQLDFRIGDYYIKDKIRTSEANFLSLNLFHSAIIDTIQVNNVDSTIALLVRLNYKKQQDYNIGFFTNRTSFDKYWNAGIEASYTHRNIFGAAQSFNPFARITLLDLSRFFEVNKQELEYQIGINLSQPTLWTIDKARIGGSTQFAFSYKRVIDNLWLSTFDLPIRLNVKMPKWTVFNNAFVDVGFRRQIPTNYDDALSQALNGAKNERDSLIIAGRYAPFMNTNSFDNNEKPYLTSTIISMGLNGDSRNDLFSPTKGYFASLLFDIAPFPINIYTGSSRFIRMQAFVSKYFSISYQSIIAYKIKLGHIIWFDPDRSVIPYDLQFYAGGANSIRGWASRRLRYFGIEGYKHESNHYMDFIEDYFGSSTLLEGSIEYRYKIAGLGYRSIMQNLLKDVQLAAFLDFGNAYNWYYFATGPDKDKKFDIKEIFKGIAVAAGVGVRYESPIGIIRLDLGWKVLDPNHFNDPSTPISSSLSDVKLHIGLGHPF